MWTLELLFGGKFIVSQQVYYIFDEWSFYQWIKYKNHIRSDEEFKEKVKKDVLEISQPDKDRLKNLKDEVFNWKRPKMETIAKSMEFKFLYDYGYDHASSSVHPLITDGSLEFFDITGLEKYDNQNTEIMQNNSILVGTLLLQEGLNNSGYKWMSIVYDCIDGIRKELDNHCIDNVLPLRKLNRALLDNPKLDICSK